MAEASLSTRLALLRDCAHAGGVHKRDERACSRRSQIFTAHTAMGAAQETRWRSGDACIAALGRRARYRMEQVVVRISEDSGLMSVRQPYVGTCW